MADALEVINNDPKVQSIFINIFGGITRGEEVANGIVAGARPGRASSRRSSSASTAPTPRRAGRSWPSTSPTGCMSQADDARGRPQAAVELAGRRAEPWRSSSTRTPRSSTRASPARQGRFYGLRNRDYGTQVVAGTNPKKAGTDVDGIPIFASVAEAVAATGATASCIFIPAPGVQAAVLEAAEARHRAHRRASPRACPPTTRPASSTRLQAGLPRHVQLLGPNCPGHHQPGQVQHRHHRRRDRQGRRPGRHREPLGHAHLPGAATS